MKNSKLIGIMAERGYTQRKLAEVLGVSKNTISDKLNGRGYFDTKQAVQICEVLKITDNATKCEIFLQ